MPRRKLRLLFAIAEVEPFLKTGGLGDVGGALPKIIRDSGCQVSVVMPKYQTIPMKYQNKMKKIKEFNVRLGWRDQYCGIEKLYIDGINYYFIDNEYYFKRQPPYGHYDDGERFAFFAKAICEMIFKIDEHICDILHCHDWHTALTPVYLRELYQDRPNVHNIKTVFNIHNILFQGKYDRFMLDDVLGLANIKAAAKQLDQGNNTINYMKGAIHYSDIITTVSSTYANEILTPTYGEGLETVLNQRKDDLYGIINGIDDKLYDPTNDPYIPYHFFKDDLTNKQLVKNTLLKEFRLEPNLPLIIVVSRLSKQKGMDLIKGISHELFDLDANFIILGTGEREYEEMFNYWSNVHSKRISSCIMFDPALSHQLYASADILLMPSWFEPCGLAQMIAMRYGTLPIVRETGGLKDSVEPYNQYTKTGNGFSFANYNAHELLFTLKHALSIYQNQPTIWHKLMINAMNTNFSWQRSSQEYIKIYRKLQPLINGYYRQ